MYVYANTQYANTRIREDVIREYVIREYVILVREYVIREHGSVQRQLPEGNTEPLISLLPYIRT